MNRLLVLAALLIASPARAEISDSVKASCMDAKDFVGCVKALSGGVDIKSDDGLNSLRNSMKKVSARLEAGTSLRDSSITFQPVVDQLAIDREEYPGSLAVKAAAKAADLFDILQAAWQGRIQTLMSGSYGTVTYSCVPTANGIKQFNNYVGSIVVKGYSVKRGKNVDLGKGGFLGTNRCVESTVKHNERSMIRFVVGVLQEGAVSPEVIEKYEADRAEAIRLANMEAWQKNLENNPALKIWAKANPAMAENEREKYNMKNPQKKVNLPSYGETLEYISKFNPSIY